MKSNSNFCLFLLRNHFILVGCTKYSILLFCFSHQKKKKLASEREAVTVNRVKTPSPRDTAEKSKTESQSQRERGFWKTQKMRN